MSSSNFMSSSSSGSSALSFVITGSNFESNMPCLWILHSRSLSLTHSFSSAWPFILFWFYSRGGTMSILELTLTVVRPLFIYPPSSADSIRPMRLKLIKDERNPVSCRFILCMQSNACANKPTTYTSRRGILSLSMGRDRVG